ncbi:hypothetical protein ACFY41_24535 [Streptomyces syringium]|uniref:hypothetical protein n=1 Tax=Streptomyces syringium TaxID=76729 RepID=UPI0036976E1A
MSVRHAFRATAIVMASAALGLGLASGAQAAGPAVAPAARDVAAVAPAADHPFEAMELDGLKVKRLTMWPAGHPVSFWALVLDEKRAGEKYSGGKFFVYAPATKEFGWFLNMDIVQRTVSHPGQVVIVDSEFLRSHPRVEVRYGNPDRPERARFVASATTWM